MKTLMITLFMLISQPVLAKDIVIDIELNVSIEKAWDAWTKNELLESWLTTKASVTPIQGGNYELFWDPTNPSENSTIGCKVIGIEKLRFLSFQWKGPVPYADLMNTSPMPTWVLITFEAIDSSKTLIHFRHSGWGNSKRWEEARYWQMNAWIPAFKKLKEL